MKQKYIDLYLNKSITKCVANAIQTSRSLLSKVKLVFYMLLARALNNLGGDRTWII